MANADVLEVARRWATSGLLDSVALFQSHDSWRRRSFSHAVPAAAVHGETEVSELSRLDLPSYVLFACLDVSAKGHVSKDVVCQLKGMALCSGQVRQRRFGALRPHGSGCYHLRRLQEVLWPSRSAAARKTWPRCPSSDLRSERPSTVAVFPRPAFQTLSCPSLHMKGEWMLRQILRAWFGS